LTNNLNTLLSLRFVNNIIDKIFRKLIWKDQSYKINSLLKNSYEYSFKYFIVKSNISTSEF